MLKDILVLARPHQYIKNLFVFLPAFFAIKLHDPEVIWSASVAFVAFCLVASGVYIFNDWQDRFEDRKHPEKQHRPIASGRVQASQAFVFLTFFLLIGGLFAVSLDAIVLALIAFYFLLNIAYTAKLKHQPIIDISCISIGFILRLFVGAVATNVVLSHWIIVMTFLLALFLSLAKRRDDVIIYASTKNRTRKLIDGYNLKFLDAAMVMTASIVVIAYIMWSISPTYTSTPYSQYIFLTSIFVILGMLRYMQIAFVEEKSSSPTKIIFRDIFIQMTLLGWISVLFLILYV
ncbi:MAG: decaprenyl-phosphate phosphoribosyltransferase [bacterium]